MHGVNWVDCVILFFVAYAVQRARDTNFWSRLFTAIGFFTGLLPFGWLLSHALSFIDDPAMFAIVNANVVLITSVFLAIVGNTLGYRVHINLDWGKKMRVVEPWLSIMFGSVSVLTAAWLIAAVIGRLPFEGFSNSANDAFIIQVLDRALPQPPTVFRLLGRYVDANAQPRAFVDDEVVVPKVPTAVMDIKEATAKAKAALVRVTSFGCGGIVSGTGFAVGPGIVATNAHVIAGVKRPIVKYKDASYAATPVFFDPEIDFAILKADNLKAQPLELAAGNVASNTAVAVVGYPGGNYSAVPGVILSKLIAQGRSIYDIAEVGRDIYIVQMKINEGSSGSPIVLADGRVAGIVFAKSNIVKDYGFALTADSISSDIHDAIDATERVGTGVCSVE